MKKKVLIFLIVLGLIGAATVFDLVRSRMFTIELVSMTPNPAVADGQTLVEVSVRLLDYRGRPVQGHALYALARTGGMFRSPRQITGEDGIAHFIFFPIKASGVVQLQDAVLGFVDESNSVFIEIGTKADFVLPLIEPPEEKIDDDLLEGIFG